MRSMSVARLCRSRWEPTYFCGGLSPVRSNASLQHRVEDLRIDKGPIRHLVGDEQRAGRPTPAIPDVVDDGVADVVRQRHAVVPLALAADQDCACTPVDVVELDRDDLGRAQAKAGESNIMA